MKITVLTDHSLRLEATPGPMTIGVSALEVPTERDSLESDRPYTVVFDGHCKVCGRLVRLLRWWDRTKMLEIIPSQTPGVQARFPWIPARAYMESVQLIGPGGRTWQGAAAIERVLNVLPKGRLFSWVFKLPFVRALAERFYRWFASNRYMLGCGKHCQYREADLDYEEGESREAVRTP